MATTTHSMPAQPPLWQRLPVVRQVRQSVGLQRGMLVAGLVLTGRHFHIPQVIYRWL